MNESQIIEIESGDWHGQQLSAPREALLAELERGKVLVFPKLGFALTGPEQALLDPALADPGHKNISLEPQPQSPSQLHAHQALHGVLGDLLTQAAVRAMVARYQASARTLVDGLFPQYRASLRAAPTSLRLHEVETRHTSWRKDDSRLHIDAFPSRPNYGERILRVFTNLNPHGKPRVWRVGEPFEDVAKRFLPRIKPQWPGAAWALAALHITKSRRSAYDHLMLHLHDAMKADLGYQQQAPQELRQFMPGNVWICFSDQTSHAVMAGQFMLEQTFFLPARRMAQPECAPLGILERLTGRKLV